MCRVQKPMTWTTPTATSHLWPSRGSLNCSIQTQVGKCHSGLFLDQNGWNLLVELHTTRKEMTQLVICQHIWRKSEFPKSNDDLGEFGDSPGLPWALITVTPGSSSNSISKGTWLTSRSSIHRSFNVITTNSEKITSYKQLGNGRNYWYLCPNHKRRFIEQPLNKIEDHSVILKIERSRAGEMTQCLWTLSALEENPRLVPSTEARYSRPLVSPAPKGSVPSSHLLQHHIHVISN